MVDTVTLNDAIKKIDSGEPLTKAQEDDDGRSCSTLLLQPITRRMFPGEPHGGEVGAQSVPFMLEFILNPASGIGGHNQIGSQVWFKTLRADPSRTCRLEDRWSVSRRCRLSNGNW